MCTKHVNNQTGIHCYYCNDELFEHELSNVTKSDKGNIISCDGCFQVIKNLKAMDETLNRFNTSYNDRDINNLMSFNAHLKASNRIAKDIDRALNMLGL